MVGLVVPTGYSFNLDGTCIYLTMAAVFIAQAVGVDLSLADQLMLVGVLLLTSKGAAGVTGSGFVTLAATLAALGGKVPVEGVALILGVDRFMSEARAITNFIGNGVATMVVAKWEGLRDDDKMLAAFAAGPEPDAPCRSCATPTRATDACRPRAPPLACPHERTRPTADPRRLRPHGPGPVAPCAPSARIAASWRAVSRKVGQRVIDGVPQFAASELSGVPAFDVAIDFSLAGGVRPDAGAVRRARRGPGVRHHRPGRGAARGDRCRRQPHPAAVGGQFQPGRGGAERTGRARRGRAPGWDCDIVEAHHAQKKDAPSGTALALGASAAAGRGAGRATPACARATSSASTRCSSPPRASASNWSIAPATATSSRAARCTRRRSLAGREPGLYRLRDLL